MPVGDVRLMSRDRLVAVPLGSALVPPLFKRAIRIGGVSGSISVQSIQTLVVGTRLGNWFHTCKVVEVAVEVDLIGIKLRSKLVCSVNLLVPIFISMMVIISEYLCCFSEHWTTRRKSPSMRTCTRSALRALWCLRMELTLQQV